MNLSLGLEISGEVMAISGMASENHGAVKSGKKSLWNKDRIDPAGAHDPDDPRVGRILKPRDPREVRPGIRAPVTKEGQYLGFESHNYHPLNPKSEYRNPKQIQNSNFKNSKKTSLKYCLWVPFPFDV
jgi:hypothetical protein